MPKRPIFATDEGEPDDDVRRASHEAFLRWRDKKRHLERTLDHLSRTKRLAAIQYTESGKLLSVTMRGHVEPGSHVVCGPVLNRQLVDLIRGQVKALGRAGAAWDAARDRR